jgi:hypothetical protein
MQLISHERWATLSRETALFLNRSKVGNGGAENVER